MAKSDKHHFDNYPLQTRIKHQILTGYLPPYLHILKGYEKRVLFLDGFAGRGTYDDPDTGMEVPGPPLLALSLIAGDPTFTKIVHTGFFEPRADHFAALEKAVQAFVNDNPEVVTPVVENGGFVASLKPILADIDSRGTQLIPTFLFVDPCGVDDVQMDLIADVLRRPKCEVFMFLNVNAVHRIAGLRKADRETPSLIEMYGNQATVDDLFSRLGSAAGSAERDSVVVGMYADALRTNGKADFVIPFRVEYEDRRATSHYLIHATKNALGFKIMKEVMWKAGRGDDSAAEHGRMELLQASAGDLSSGMRRDLADLRQEVLSHLGKAGRTRVGEICNEWASRPDDFFPAAAYKRTLIEMEEQGLVKVIDKDGSGPKPADQRPKRKGKSTLADDYLVEIVD